jgi:fatty-acyl-CoA synthase
MQGANTETAGATVVDVLRDQAEHHPDAPFVTFGGHTLSYCQVATQVRALAVGLHNLGIEPGDRIAVNLPNWPEFVITALAVAELGGSIVPLNPGYSPRELQFMLRNSEACVAVTAERYRGVDYLQMFETLLSDLPDLQYLVTVGEEDLWYDDRIFQFEDLVSSGMGREFEPARIDPAEDLFAIIFTPGIAGTPKGVMLTHENLMTTGRATADALRLNASDITLCSVPLFHVFGLGVALMTVLASGSTVVLQERFASSEALDLIASQRVTIVHGVPTMFVLLLRDPGLGERDLSSLRSGIVAGAPVSEELVEEARSRLVPELEIAYGLTETSPTVSLTGPGDQGVKRSQTVGRPLDGISVRIISEEDETELPPESIGELAVRGFNVMQGYFRQPNKTAAAFTADGFFKTGDLAMLDEDGYLHIVGRESEVIIRGGYNVHPREVEDLLRSHPAVEDVVVLGTPNEVLGELVCACVVPVEGALITDEELRDFCREGVSDYKIPDLIRFLEVFPTTPGGRARRAELARLVRSEES